MAEPAQPPQNPFLKSSVPSPRDDSGPSPDHRVFDRHEPDTPRSLEGVLPPDVPDVIVLRNPLGKPVRPYDASAEYKA